MEAVFPIHLTWHATGEAEAFKDTEDLLCNLEHFDSADPAWSSEARAVDALGHPVHLRVNIVTGLCEVERQER